MLNLLQTNGNAQEFSRFALPQTEQASTTFRPRFSPVRREQILKTQIRPPAETVADMARCMLERGNYNSAVAIRIGDAANACRSQPDAQPTGCI
eukprot:COSAG02_NODE_19866_length_861_cov_0.711286_1_plen_93_part_10